MGILRLMLFSSMVLFAACATGNQEWPAYVTDNLWIPKDAQISDSRSNGSYKIFYTVEACYPAKELLDDMLKTMAAKGWRRLSSDPINPSVNLKLNHTIGPEGTWGCGTDPAFIRWCDWREFWEDDKKNMIHYVFKYRLEEKQLVESACTLSGYASYMSAEQMRALLETFQKWPVKAP